MMGMTLGCAGDLGPSRREGSNPLAEVLLRHASVRSGGEVST